VISLVTPVAVYGFHKPESRFDAGKRDQNSVDNQNREDLPLARRSFKPKLPLKEALQISDRYIADNRIDVSQYYLSQVRFILHDSQKSKVAGWHVWWVHESGVMGNYIELFVDMDGNVKRLTSM
jgi:hypothetical protein